jgi:Zinc-binding domain
MSVEKFIQKAPFEGAIGQWVLREECTQTKSFGIFECRKCNKAWPSAHAFKDLKQKCKNCMKYRLPEYMWENEDDRRYRDNDRDVIDVTKPHRHDLCQACQRGICKDGGY